MKITVAHSTAYRYESPVILEPHIFRLQPRNHGAQRLLSFDLRITPPPAGTTECLDQDGNLATNAWFSAPTTELIVTSDFTVEMLRENPFDYVITGESLSLPQCYREPLSAALAPYRHNDHVDESVRQFAQSVAAESQFHTLSFLVELSQRMHRNFRQLTRPEGPPWPSPQTLHLEEGSCRDLAVLFCDACRAMGIAARFVSGYECASERANGSYMHAWAEIYLPGIGWRGYDPSRGLAVSNGHVAVAAGFDHKLATPVSGWYAGFTNSHMEATLRLHVDIGG